MIARTAAERRTRADVKRIRTALASYRVATDRELNQKMGEAARKKGAEKNTWQDYGDRLLAEYARRLNR